MVALLLALAACDGPVDCEALAAGFERDRCLHGQVGALPPTQAAEARRLAAQIVDPVVRGAAVSAFVTRHNSALDRAEGQALCDLLDGPRRAACRRKLDAVHLSR